MQVNNWNAIAAMSENRVIGLGNRLPWRIPADMDWFTSATNGQILVMGRKTLESLQVLHPQNTYIVLTRNQDYRADMANIQAIHDVAHIPATDPAGRSIWICGGGEVYRQTLSRCRNLYLTTIKECCEGDTFFPAFEDAFLLAETLQEDSRMTIRRYQNKYDGGQGS